MSVVIDQGAMGHLPERVLKPQDAFGGANPLGQPSQLAKLGKSNGDFGTSLQNQVLETAKVDAPRGLVDGLVESVNAKQMAAAESRRAFLAGESNNLHQTMIASQEASVAFSLMVEMRNKVMEAYQELMRMQI